MRKTLLAAVAVAFAGGAASAHAGELIVPARFQSKQQRKHVLTTSVKKTPREVLEKIKKGPKPGAYLDGDDRLVLVGKGARVRLKYGAAHIEVFPGEGEVTVPAGVRMRARAKNVGHWTKLEKVEGEGQVTLPRDVRRVFYFDGRQAQDDACFAQTGSGCVFVRGFEAAVELDIDEWEGRVREYRFPKLPTYLTKKQDKRAAKRDTWRQLGSVGIRLFTLGSLF